MGILGVHRNFRAASGSGGTQQLSPNGCMGTWEANQNVHWIGSPGMEEGLGSKLPLGLG